MMMTGLWSANLNMLMNSPLETINVRQQTGATRKGFATCAKEIYTEEGGFGGYYKALAPTLLLGLNPSITLAFFTQIKNALQRMVEARGDQKELGVRVRHPVMSHSDES